MVGYRPLFEKTGSMIAIFYLAVAVLCGAVAFAGDKSEKKDIYDPNADARADIRAAVATAKREGKNLLIQVGGNWCKWCLRLEKLMKADEDLRTLLDQFVYLHVNYSKENKNLEVMADLGNPQRFGFPVLLVLDAEGKLLHTQDSVFLEKGEGYDSKMVARFLESWTPKAVKGSEN